MTNIDTGKPKYHLVRFNDLRPLSANPPDTLLPRYQRQRFPIVGRANERRPGDPGIAIEAPINFGILRCGPGKGNCSHKHANWEIFIPLSGRWRIALEGGELDERGDLILNAWDVIVVPPDTFHEATNLSDGDACMLSLNPGKSGAAYVLHPDVIEELRTLGARVADAALRGVDVTNAE